MITLYKRNEWQEELWWSWWPPFEVAVAYCFVRKVEFSNRLLFGAVGVVQHEYAALKLLFVLSFTFT